VKFSQFKRVLKEDLAASSGEDKLPKWLDSLLQPINLFIEQVAQALQNRLNFEDNFYAKTVTLSFTSDVELEVNPTTPFAKTARAGGVLLLGAGGVAVSNFQWENKNNGNLGITVTFLSAADAECTFLILLR